MKAQSKPILHLNLTLRWYDMIDRGIKKEEYREIKPYWNRVFCENGKIKIRGKHYHPTDVVICFSQGFKRDRMQMYFKCAGLSISDGNNNWGAEPNTQYHTLKIGTRVKI